MTDRPDFKKFPKIKRIGHEKNNGILEGGSVLLEEKMDGANFRFRWDPNGERIVFGSRKVAFWNEEDTSQAFEHAVEYVREEIDQEMLSETSRGEGVTVFGEAMHSHTLHYDWDNVPSFLGFAVWDHDEGEFMDHYMARTFIKRVLGLPVVQLYYSGPTGELPDSFPWEGEAWPESEYRDGRPEGVVIKNLDTGQIAKYRTQEFKERHSTQSVSNPDDYEPSDAEALARQYTTEARVLKQIHKFRDRGETVEMSLMEDLWREVFDDIIEEEYEELFLGNYTINTKSFRSEVAGITSDVLETYLQRPDDSVLNEVQP